MSPHWERHPHPPQDLKPVFMDAVLTPNRSLTRKGFARLLAAFAGLNACVSAIFVAQGAYPVAAFLALDVALLWLAFDMNYRAGRAQERVRVGAGVLHVVRRSPKGAAEHWVVSPLWAQVSADETSVRIASAGRDVPVGAFLSPHERESFREALATALSRARREGFAADGSV